MKATQREREKKALRAALLKLREEIPIGDYTVKWEVPTSIGTVFDGVVNFENILDEYAIEIKMNLNHNMLDALEFYLQAVDRTVLLVTEAITDRTAMELRCRNIQYIDTVGNMYITQENPFILLHKTGNRPSATTDKRLANAYVGARLRVIFALLVNEDAVNFTYREVAKVARVALGTVGSTFKELKLLKYIRVYKHKRKLMNREKLVTRWLEAYPTEIRPKLNPKCFTAPDRNWWIQEDLKKYGVILGGETAAAVLTKHLHPEHGVLYTKGDIHELAKTLRLRADPGGNLTIMDQFWESEAFYVNNIPIAPPILVCAELFAEGGERNVEVVKIIKDNFDV